MPDSQNPKERGCINTFAELGIPLMVLKPDGVVMYANPQADSTLGHPPGTLAGMSLDSLLSHRNPVWLSSEIRKNALEGGWSGEAVLVNSFGKGCWVHIQACRAPTVVGNEPALLAVIEDVSGHIEFTNTLMQRSEELYMRNHELEALSRIGRLMLENSDLESRLSILLREAAGAIKADRASVFVLDRASGDLICRCTYGENPDPLVGKARMSVDDECYTARAVRLQRTEVIENVYDEPDLARKFASPYGIRSLLVTPILAGSEATGALLLGNRDKHRHFTNEDITLAEILAGYAGSAIENSRLSEDIRDVREQVNRASRWAAIGELLAGAAHNFGNILMAVQGTLQQALLVTSAEHAVPDELKKSTETALRHVAKGTELVHRLLRFSQGSEHGTGRTSLHIVIKAAIDLCGTHPSAKQRKILNKVTEDIPRVAANPGPLQEVIVNLLLNALQATEPGGEVRMEAEVDEGCDMVELRVIDNGPGVDPELTSRIFEPFFSTKGGAGLGLSSSAALIHAMGGVMTLESKVGQGATFRIRLKKAEQRPNANAKAA
jgi:PAS domain S-box-containing protein